jgi:hypothetical protein
MFPGSAFFLKIPLLSFQSAVVLWVHGEVGVRELLFLLYAATQ